MNDRTVLQELIGEQIVAVGFTLEHLDIEMKAGILRIFSNAVLDVNGRSLVLGSKPAAAGFSRLVGASIGQLVVHPSREIILDLEDGRKLTIPLDKGSRAPLKAVAFIPAGTDDEGPAATW